MSLIIKETTGLDEISFADSTGRVYTISGPSTLGNVLLSKDLPITNFEFLVLEQELLANACVACSAFTFTSGNTFVRADGTLTNLEFNGQLINGQQ